MEMVYWPSWRFGPNGEKAVFNSAEEVPAGWSDAPQEAATSTESTTSTELEEVAAEEWNASSANAWDGISKDFMIQLLRDAGHKVHANTSAKKAYEKCIELNLFSDGNEGESDASEEGK